MSQLKIITASLLWAALSSAHAQGTPPDVAFIDNAHVNLDGANAGGEITVKSSFDESTHSYSFKVTSAVFKIASFHIIISDLEQITSGGSTRNDKFKFTPDTSKGPAQVPPGTDLTWQALSNESLTGAGMTFDLHGPSLSKTDLATWKLKFDYIPGVPEPETYALMIAGLAVVAAQARKRTMR